MGFLPHSCLLKLIEVAIDQGYKKCTIPVFVFWFCSSHFVVVVVVVGSGSGSGEVLIVPCSLLRISQKLVLTSMIFPSVVFVSCD